MEESNFLDHEITTELDQLINDSFSLKNRKIENLQFNFFNLTSAHYYKENYHSDILKAFLDNHLFLEFFLNDLNKNFPHLEIDNSDYSDYEVLREVGKIDIWIRDLSSKKSILIENKINDAIDMHRQIPRYVDYALASNYEIDAIIYLSIDGKKQPEKKSWTETEINCIDQKLIPLAGYNENFNDLFTLFQKFELEVPLIDYLVLSRQYRNLLSNLAVAVMNKPLHDSLYQTCINETNFNKLKELTQLFNLLPKVRAKKIQEAFENNCSPFKRVSIWTNKIAYFDEWKPSGIDSNFAIDITCNEENYVVDFFDRNALEDDNTSVYEYLKSAGIHAFEKQERNRRMKKVFQFPKQEEELYSFLQQILTTLNFKND